MGRWIRWGALGAAALLGASLAVGSLTSNDTALDSGGAKTDSGGAKTVSAEGPAFLPQAAIHGPTARDADGLFAATGGGSTAEEATGASSAGYGDRIIRSTMLTIEVDEGDFDAAWNAVNDIAIALGAEVLDVQRGDDPRYAPVGGDRVRSGSITIRVPSARLEEATRRFRTSVGEVRSETTTSQDVTEEYIDLSSRLRNLRAERAVLLTLFDRARTIRDTLAVQGRLGEVQGEIERVTGRIRFIERSTEFSTLTISIAEPGATILPAPGDDPSFARAWDTALEGLVRIATAAMIGTMWFAPFVIVAAALWSWRRRRPAAPAAPATPAAPAA